MLMLPRRAIFPAILYQKVRRKKPLIFWDNLHEITLDLFWSLLRAQAPYARHSHHMRIHRYPIHYAVCSSQLVP